jgi:ribonucleoside-triphosphate reductase
LTGSIGVVTLNLPRYAFEASSPEEFLEIVGSYMDVARDSLTIKRKVLEKFTESGLYPYSMFYLRAVKEATGSYWRNHFSTIGVIGMNDALLNLIGKDIGTDQGIALAVRTLDFMRERMIAYQEEGEEIYNLEATPAEGVSYRLARIDARRNPGIRIYNQTLNGRARAVPYYTNSTQLPVGHTDDIFEALRLQDPLQTRYTGGTVLHGFLGERLPSTAAARQLVRSIAENFHLPYYTLTPTFSICPGHGYVAGEHETCPTCGETCEVWSRSVGYLRPVDQWNEGKQEEFRDRRTYDRQVEEARAAGGAGDTSRQPAEPARA